MKRDIDERFWSKVKLEDSIFPENGCMIWAGAKDAEDYPYFQDSGKVRRATRWIYQHLRGPIPEGLQLDHLCRVHSCVNPDHLEPVTGSINTRRGLAPRLLSQRQKERHAARTHCKNGHKLSFENTYVHDPKDGTKWRVCRTCQREAKRRFNERRIRKIGLAARV